MRQDVKIWVVLLFLTFLAGCGSQRPFRSVEPHLGLTDGVPEVTTIRHHDIDLHLDLESGGIEVEDRIDVAVIESPLQLVLRKGLEIDQAMDGSQPVPFEVITSNKTSNLITLKVPNRPDGKATRITLKYHGQMPRVDFSDGRHRGSEVGGYVNQDSALLLANANWYPNIPEQNALITYDLRVFAPKGQEVMAAGDRRPPGGLFKKQKDTSFRMRYPTEGINVISGPYHVRTRKVKGITLATFFTDDDEKQSEAYLSGMERHLNTFQERFGRYPYASMAVVDSPLMEGLGFPQFTIIGKRLLPIPGMIQGSLGHELLHNWWGNSVYPSMERGNWSEGLTTYLHEHTNAVKKNGGAAARRELLERYTTYTQSGPEPSLAEFREREDGAGLAVGYDKATFVFGMLEDEVGTERFYSGLRRFGEENRFRIATWEDLRRAMEKEAGQSLETFFKQWVETAGAPHIRVEEATLGEGGAEATLVLETDPLFQQKVPIVIKTDSGVSTTVVSIASSPQTISLKASGPIRAITVDPEYTVLRKLLPEELPPTIASVLETDATLPVLFSEALTPPERQQYEGFLEIAEVRYNEIRDLNENKGPTVLFGPPDETGQIGGWIPKEVPWQWNGHSLTIDKATIGSGKDTGVFAWRGPNGAAQPIVWIVGYSTEGLRSLAMRLGYYMASSYVLLAEGKPAARGEWKSKGRPLEITFPSNP